MIYCRSYRAKEIHHMDQLPAVLVPFDSIVTKDENFQGCPSVMKEIEGLKESIAENGLIHPLGIWAGEEGERVDSPLLISGKRRWAAIRLLREDDPEVFETVRCVIRYGDISDAEAHNLEENIQREPPNKADEAVYVTKLYERLGDQSSVAKKLGKTQGWVSQKVTLVNNAIPPVMAALREGLINYTTAKSISTLLLDTKEPDWERQRECLDKVLGKEVKPASLKKNTRRTRSYADILEMKDLMRELNEETDIDKHHRLSVIQTLDWVLRKVEDEDMVFPASYPSDALSDSDGNS
jgi:ParB/RepB/Spo0J family partition protein